MKGHRERSLKTENFKWHVALASTHVIVVALFVAPELVTSITTTRLGLYRLVGAVVLPIFVLLLVNVLSSNAKAALVYWKPIGVLPGAEAFTKYGPADARVDMAQLKRNVGVLPTDPKEQNSKWYKLYKMVENHIEVSGAQKEFLMYRDMAVLSLFLLVLVPAGLYLLGVGAPRVWGAAAWFAFVYLAAARSAKHVGERFVSNVLAVHSAKKITAARATTASSSSSATS